MKNKNTLLGNFKSDFRMMTFDVWGDAKEAWFEALGQMNSRTLEIPKKYKYKAWDGTDGVEPDSFFHELFKNASNEELIQVAEFLFRYCQFLSFKGIDKD